MSAKTYVSAVRILSSIITLVIWLGLVHAISAVANYHSTRGFLEAAQSKDAALRHRYESPLIDILFFEEDSCVHQGLFGVEWLGMALASDLNIWMAGAFTLLKGISALLSGESVGVEYSVVMSMAHSVFMSMCQVVTLMPQSAGLGFCTDNNPLGVEGWPWYGVSFITQSFAGAVACADMIYSGHIAHIIIFAGTGSFFIRNRRSSIMYWVISASFAMMSGTFLALCRDHYTVDIVLGSVIAVLLVTNPYLQRLAEGLASVNRKIEDGVCRRFLGVADEDLNKNKVKVL